MVGSINPSADQTTMAAAPNALSTRPRWIFVVAAAFVEPGPEADPVPVALAPLAVPVAELLGVEVEGGAADRRTPTLDHRAPALASV